MWRSYLIVAALTGIPAFGLLWCAAFGPPPFLGIDRASQAQVALHVGYIAGLVTLAAIAVAWVAILLQRQTARAQTTLHHLAKMEFDQDFLRAKRVFLEEERNGSLTKWAARDLAHEKTARYIRLYLNHFELVSLGVQHKIIDYDIFRAWNRKTVLVVWAAASPFVHKLRKEFDNEQLFLEFEELAKEFSGGKRRRFR
jgi:hypothetical protein